MGAQDEADVAINTCSGSVFMVVADFTNLILRHIQTSKTFCRLVLIYNRIADLQQNRRFATTMNPDPAHLAHLGQ